MADEKTNEPKNDEATKAPPAPKTWDAISKITLSDIGCNGAAAGALNKDGQRILLCRLVGRATGSKMKEDKRTNEFHTSLTGEFRAINMQEGTENYGKGFASGVAYLPAGLHEQILSVIESAEAEGHKATVEFAYDVYAYKKDRPGAKYSYAAKALTEPSAEDPMTKLLGALPQPEVPKLEAPKAA